MKKKMRVEILVEADSVPEAREKMHAFGKLGIESLIEIRGTWESKDGERIYLKHSTPAGMNVRGFYVHVLFEGAAWTVRRPKDDRNRDPWEGFECEIVVIGGVQ